MLTLYSYLTLFGVADNNGYGLKVFAFLNLNIYFYDIDTPLKQFVTAHDNIVQHCRAIHQAVSEAP